MTTYNVSMKDLPTAMDNVIRLGMKECRRAMYRAAHRGIARVTSEIDAKKPKLRDTGAYRASWKALAIEEGAVLFAEAPYAEIIERGTRPFFPNLGALQEWVLRRFKGDLGKDYRASVKAAKLMKAFGAMATGSAESGGVAIDREDYIRLRAAQIALAIARKIAAHGLPPYHILENCLPDLQKFSEEEIQRSLDALG